MNINNNNYNNSYNPNNNIVYNNNNNSYNPNTKRDDKNESTPRNLAILISIWSLVVVILSIVSTTVHWSDFSVESYYRNGWYYIDYPIKPGGYIKALIVISIILLFLYCISLITYIIGKLPSSVNAKLMNLLVIIGVISQVTVVVCAFADVDKDLKIRLALGTQNKPKEGTYIFIVSTILYIILAIISWSSINKIINIFENKQNNLKMNSFAPNQINSNFPPQVNNTQERQYFQQLEQHIQQLHLSQNSPQMSNVQSTLQQTIDQLSNYLVQLRNFQAQIQNNTNVLSSPSTNNQQYYPNNNNNQV